MYSSSEFNFSNFNKGFPIINDGSNEVIRSIRTLFMFFSQSLVIALVNWSFSKNELSLTENSIINWSQDLVLPSTLNKRFTQFISFFEKSWKWNESFVTFFCWCHCWLWAGYNTRVSSVCYAYTFNHLVNPCPPKLGLLKKKVLPLFISSIAYSNLRRK